MTAAEFAARWGGHVPGPMGVRRRFAVLIPLVEAPDGLRLLFEVRAAGLRQGGEVCFPGGRAEQDESALDCALREARDELSIPREEIRVLGMTDYLLHQRGFLLQPVVGLVSPVGMAALSPSPAEVAEVFTVPADFFRDTEPSLYRYGLTPNIPPDFPYDAIGIGPDYHWGAGEVEVPVWRYEEHVIWGMTARILRDMLGQME